jgi:hypothetical protein
MLQSLSFCGLVFDTSIHHLVDPIVATLSTTLNVRSHGIPSIDISVCYQSLGGLILVSSRYIVVVQHT